MKTVLIIGSDFAPSGLPPATRIRFFASHLPEFGWNPIVLTAKPNFYDWKVDPENEQLLPKSLEIIRTNAFRPSWTRRLGVGDIGMRSFWHHWQATKRLCRERRIDLIFIPVPPYVPMLIGRLAHGKFGIPYVVDYIDPWVTEYYWTLPRKQRPPKWAMAYAMARLLEPFSIKRVGHITGVSKGTTDSVLKRYEQLRETDATEIPYGAEVDDFEYLRQHPRVNPVFDPDDGLLHLSCVGACIPGMYPSVRALFAAVSLGLKNQPNLFGRLRLHFVGTSYANKGAPENVLLLAREAGIESQVTEQPARIPYLDSLQVMLDSQALFLLGSDEPHYTASKIFPYMLARRPILAIFHEQSSVVNILREAAVGRVVTFGPDRAPEVSQVLVELESICISLPSFTTTMQDSVLEPYTTRVMSARLANSFDCVLTRGAPIKTTISGLEKRLGSLD